MNTIEIKPFCDFKKLETIGGVPLKNSQNFNYLCKYLVDLKCTHYLVEKEYLSRSYLYDYTHFYAAQTEKYSKYTQRIHFFEVEKSVDIENFNDIYFYSYYIRAQKDLPRYLGHTILKPLYDPNSVLGVTMLKTYSVIPVNGIDEVKRYPCVRDYKVNLFGKTLEIETLISQSQDAVSACASTALFSTTQLLSVIFKTEKLFPSQITKLAHQYNPNNQRVLPNRNGLDSKQVVSIFRHLKLTHEYIPLSRKNSLKTDLSRLEHFKGLVYAYNYAKIPVLVMVERFDEVPPLVNITKSNNVTVMEEPSELHLVLNTGFKLNYAQQIEAKDDQLKLFSNKLSRCYWIDDNYGPQTKVEIKKNENYDFETKGYKSNKDKDNSEEREDIAYSYDKLYAVIIPLEKGLIVDYDTIFRHVKNFAVLLEFFKLENGAKPEWEIFLTLSNEYKSKVMQYPNDISDKDIQTVLLSCLSKYVWIARLATNKLINGEEVTEIFMEFVFDSTVSPEAPNFCRAILSSKVILTDDSKVKFKNRIKDGIKDDSVNSESTKYVKNTMDIPKLILDYIEPV